MSKFVKVPLDVYLELETDSRELAELERWGVYNWSGYEKCPSREVLQANEEEVSYEIIEVN